MGKEKPPPSINRIEQTYRKLIAEGRSVQRFYLASPNDEGFIFPPKILGEAYQRHFRKQKYHPDPKGLLTARKAIQRYYEGQGVGVDVEGLVLTSGTSESFFYLFSLLCEQGDNLLIPCPAYPLFDQIAKLTRIELRHYSLLEERRWEVGLEDLRKKTDQRTKAIILVSPNNPTGAVTSAEQIQEIVGWANKKQIPLICDEVFSEFYFGRDPFPRPIAVASPRLCFTLNGISKMFALPALKLSWIAVTGKRSLVEPVVDRLETTADTFLSCHAPIQEALPALFSEGKEFLKTYREEMGRRRGIAIELLRKSPDIQWVEPMGGFYLMAAIRKPLGISEEDFVIRLMQEKGIFVHPGYFYDYEEGIHFVISFLGERGKLKKGIEGLLEFIR